MLNKTIKSWKFKCNIKKHTMMEPKTWWGPSKLQKPYVLIHEMKAMNLMQTKTNHKFKGSRKSED
jgi:hypothetical protein